MSALKDIAANVVDFGIYDRWEPTTAEIMDAYDLTEKQVAKVKQYAKRYAADLGVLWGWDPKFERFRVCPANDQGANDRMLDYAYRAWGNAGKSLNYLVKGSLGMEYLVAEAAAELIKNNNRAIDTLTTVYEKTTGRSVATADA